MIISKKIVVPDEVNLYFVGDTHGCYNLYQKGLKDLGIKDTDYVISVGDLIDRGTQNIPMVSHFTQNNNRHSVMGNHEWMLYMGVYHEAAWWDCWLQNGGDSTLKEVSQDGIPLLVNLIKDLPIILEVQHRGKVFGVVHGGAPLRYKNRGFDYKETTLQDLITDAESNPQELFNMIWDRDALSAGQYHKTRNESLPVVGGVDYIFHGHSYVKNMEVHSNRVYIDTGSVFNEKICFAWLEGDTLNNYRTGDFDV